MILYRKEPVPLLMRNTMLLDDDLTGGVIYVSKGTYEQAIRVSSRFEGNTSSFLKVYTNGDTSYTEVPGFVDAYNTYVLNVSEPMNIFAPLLTSIAYNKGIDWTTVTIEQMYGYLHVMSQWVDLNAMGCVPAEVRNKVDIPTNILNSYQISWDELCATLKDYTVLKYRGKDSKDEDEEEYPAPKPKKKKKTDPEPEDEKDEESEETEEEDGEDDPYAGWDPDIVAAMKAADSANKEFVKEQEEKKKQQNDTPQQTGVITSNAQEQQAEINEMNQVLDEYADI